jgi:hypothetical protein
MNLEVGVIADAGDVRPDHLNRLIGGQEGLAGGVFENVCQAEAGNAAHTHLPVLDGVRVSLQPATPRLAYQPFVFKRLPPTT